MLSTRCTGGVTVTITSTGFCNVRLAPCAQRWPCCGRQRRSGSALAELVVQRAGSAVDGEARRRHFKMLTARAITSAAVTREMPDCAVIASFAQRDNGIESVGLKAAAFVNDT